MKIHGREIYFKRTVQATCEVAGICPDEDIANIQQVFTGTTAKVAKNIATIICALNKGYELTKQYEEDGYEPKPLTMDEVFLLDEETFIALQNEAVAAWSGEKPTVEAQPKKQKGKGKKAEGEEAEGSSSTSPGTSTTEEN